MLGGGKGCTNVGQGQQLRLQRGPEAGALEILPCVLPGGDGSRGDQVEGWRRISRPVVGPTPSLGGTLGGGREVARRVDAEGTILSTTFSIFGKGPPFQLSLALSWSSHIITEGTGFKTQGFKTFQNTGGAQRTRRIYLIADI